MKSNHNGVTKRKLELFPMTNIQQFNKNWIELINVLKHICNLTEYRQSSEKLILRNVHDVINVEEKPAGCAELRYLWFCRQSFSFLFLDISWRNLKCLLNLSVSIAKVKISEIDGVTRIVQRQSTNIFYHPS